MSKEKRFITIDCETDPFDKGRAVKPFCWGAFDGTHTSTWWEWDDGYDDDTDVTARFVHWLRQQDCIAYAHNGGRFDFLFLLPYMDTNSAITIINGAIVEAKLGLCTLRDSYALYPVSLAKMQKTSIDYGKMEASRREENKSEILDYLMDDCFFLYEWMKSFREALPTKLTLASTAHTQYLELYPERANIHSDDAYYNVFNAYYFGGRTECLCSTPYYDDKGYVYYFDINSAYPHAMQAEHPIGLDFDIHKDIDRLRPYSFLLVEAESNGNLPYRDNDGLSFPADGEKRTFHITGHEYFAFAEDVKKIIFIMTHAEAGTFKQYVDYWYGKKSAADKGTPDYLIAKLMLNSLYGKFGANPENYSDNVICEEKDLDAYLSIGWSITGILGKGLYLVGIASEKHNFYNVATSASITGYVRAMLGRVICDNRPDILYCDTDSIMVTHASPSGVRETDELGDWKLECVSHKTGIAGKKLYALYDEFDDRHMVASKGARLSPAEIYDLAKGEVTEIEYTQDAPVMSLSGDQKVLRRRISVIQ